MRGRIWDGGCFFFYRCRSLFGVVAAGCGVAAILAGSLPDLAKKIEMGDLDALLTQPKSVLLQAVSSRTRPDGWGDVASGIVLLSMSGYLGWTTWPLAVIAVGLSAATLVW